MAELIIKRVMKRKGLSARKFAKILGRPYDSVFRYFRPGFNPAFRTLEKIAKALGVKVRDLIKE